MMQPNMTAFLPDNGITYVPECADHTIARNTSRQFHAASTGINSSFT